MCNLRIFCSFNLLLLLQNAQTSPNTHAAQARHHLLTATVSREILLSCFTFAHPDRSNAKITSELSWEHERMDPRGGRESGGWYS